MKNQKQLFLICAFLTVVISSSAQNKVGAGDAFPGSVKISAFSLSQPEKVKITGTGGVFREEWQMIVYYGWILNSETRKVVWHMADKIEEKDFDFGEYNINDEVQLEKGNYELYFTGAFHQRNNDWSFRGVDGLLTQVFGNRDDVKFKMSMKEGLGIMVEGQTLSKTSSAAMIEKKTSDAVVSILKADKNANVKKGFSLSGETALKIYAIGEARKDEAFDYAWIYDVDKHKRVWVMDYGNTDFAGGADKNVVANEKITLPAGNYLVSYVTDDSHSYNDWNSMPPNDPQFTGITIWADNENSKKNVIPFRMAEETKPFLQLTKVHEDEFVSQGLTVKSPVEFRVLCIGERSDDEMADNGWIMNATTRQVVWDMADQRLEHAGGAEKNKMFDGTVRLDKGDYIVYYSTDDSHSYGDWNSAPPHEQDYYGISLWASAKEDLSKVSLFEPGTYKNDRVLVEIVRVHDDEQLNESFTLDKDTNIRIIAMGEGMDGDMVDYGWIKNTDTGKVVWEMTYRNTESAGGAKKNRLFNDAVILPKGTYKVYYETDGSHSYRHWNATPPHDQERYGISLLTERN
jgi:hypothetical protein